MKENNEQTQVEAKNEQVAALHEPGEIFLIEPQTEIEIHPLADALPMLEGEEFEQLKVSISGGQQVPVIIRNVRNGELLDGRNRWRACKELGIAVKVVEWQGTDTAAEELIVALNLHRRDLTKSQRAVFAVKLLPALEPQAAERRGARTDIRGKVPSSGKAVDLAGAKVGVSGKYVAQAKKIEEASAQTFQDLLSGKLSLAQAKTEIKAAAAPVPVPDAKQPAVKYSLYEALREIIALVPDESNGKLFDIADEAPPVIKKALVSFFPDEYSPVSAEEDGINQPSIDM